MSDSVLSARSSTSSGCAGVARRLPTEGSSISPGVISGAVTMKITSSTSITSMYGTTLIWLIDLRGRRMSGQAVRRGKFHRGTQACRCRMFENSSMKVS